MRRSRFFELSLVWACLAGGCSGGWSMAIPQDVTQHSDELPIEGRSNWSGALADESFGLDSYQVTDVDRKWNSTRSTSMFGFEDSRTHGGYSFKLASGGDALEGRCATEKREQAENLGDGAEFSNVVAKLGCTCGGEQDAATLLLDASTANQYGGSIKGPNFDFQVTALTQRENGRMPSRDPLGYRVDGDQPIGAVSVVKPGRVWLQKQLAEPERRSLACLFAGLLLYQPPTDR